MDVSMWHEKLKLMLLRSQISASYRIPTDQHWFDATKDKIVMWFIISLTVELTVIKQKSKYFSVHTFRQFSCSWNTRDFFLVCSTLPRTHCKILWLSLLPLIYTSGKYRNAGSKNKFKYFLSRERDSIRNLIHY